MNTAQVKETMPLPSTDQGNLLRHPDLDEKEWQSKVSANVQQTVPTHQRFDVVPPASAPVQNSPELKMVGAIIPDEIVQTSINPVHRDTTSLISSVLGKIFGWSDWLRHTPGNVYKRMAMVHSEQVKQNEKTSDVDAPAA